MKNYKKWLNENGLETGLTMQPSEQIFRKDGKSFSGHLAMSLKELWNAGYEQCLKDFEDFQQSRTAEENGG
jgi:hypothetical protein